MVTPRCGERVRAGCPPGPVVHPRDVTGSARSASRRPTEGREAAKSLGLRPCHAPTVTPGHSAGPLINRPGGWAEPAVQLMYWTHEAEDSRRDRDLGQRVRARRDDVR